MDQIHPATISTNPSTSVGTPSHDPAVAANMTTAMATVGSAYAGGPT
jgi:hypothetical protein